MPNVSQRRQTSDHRCPVCNYHCPQTTGRPRTTITALRTYLEQCASYENPIPIVNLAAALDLTQEAVKTAIYRLRKQGVPVRIERGTGYWIEQTPQNSGGGHSYQTPTSPGQVV